MESIVLAFKRWGHNRHYFLMASAMRKVRRKTVCRKQLKIVNLHCRVKKKPSAIAFFSLVHMKSPHPAAIPLYENGGDNIHPQPVVFFREGRFREGGSFRVISLPLNIQLFFFCHISFKGMFKKRGTAVKKRIVVASAWVLPLICLASSLSTAFDIRGKIVIGSSDSVYVDSVPGVVVFLKNHPAVRCTTNENGVFRLTDSPNSSVRQSFGGPHAGKYQIVSKKDGFLVRTIGAGSGADFRVFNADGRIVASGRTPDKAGAERFIGLPRGASTVHLVKISTAGASAVFKTIPQMNRKFTVAPGSGYESGNLRRKKAAPFVDTLVAIQRGYKSCFFGIQNYQTSDFVGKIALTNPWVNCMGPDISKSRGLNKISAKWLDFEMGQFCDTVWGGKDGNPTSDLELPGHTVFFSYDFFMDSTEVTQREYDSLMKAAYAGYVKPAWSPAYGQGPDYPAYAVSWDDAVLFCNARSKRDHLDTVYTYSQIAGSPGALSRLNTVTTQFSKSGHRLPTEAEWEYCCRGGILTDFYWGKDVDYFKKAGEINYENVNSKIVWAKNSFDLGSGDPGYGSHPVAALPPNTYNLYGMAGNVSEWCNDFAGGRYPWNSETDPTGPATGTSHVVRGGNWTSGIYYLRSPNRYFAPVPAGVEEKVLKGFRAVRKAADGE